MTVSNLTVKAAGLLFKIPLTALIGETGMGYFNSAYTLFTWLYMLSAAGLPAAASMLIARIPDNRRRDGAMRVFTTSLGIFTVVGLLGCAVLIFASGAIAHVMRVEASAPAIAAIAPTLFFVCQSAALRGYFQGFGDLRPHSVSQIAEAVGKAALGTALAYHAVNTGKSISEAAAYAAAGITVGVAAGMIILYLYFIFAKKQINERDTTPRLTVASRLIRAAFPITLSSSVMSLANLIDSLIMTRALHASGMSQAETAAVWGNYSSLAVPMFNLPPVLTMPIAYALLPALSGEIALGNREKAVKLAKDAASATAVLAVPCAVGLAAMSEPILSLLFADDVAERGAVMLTLLAPSSMLLCVLGLTNTVLQACGRERVPLYAMLCGAAVKLSATWLLTPLIGKFATPLSTFLCYLTATVISAAAIGGLTPLSGAVGLPLYIKPLVMSALSVTAAVLVYPIAGTVVSVGIAAAGYFGLMALSEGNTLGGILHKLKGRSEK